MMECLRAGLRGLLVLAVVTFPSVALAQVTAAEPVNPEQLQEKRQELATLRTRIQQIRDAVRADEDAEDALAGELRAVETRIGEVSEALRASQQSLDDLQVRLQTAMADLDLAAASLYRERQALRVQIRAAYVLGRQERLKLLLRQGEPESVGRVLVYYDYLHAARSRRISTYSEQLAVLRTLEAEIARHHGEIEQLQRTQAKELEIQQDARRERQALLEALQRRLQENQDALSTLERDEAALHNLVRELQTALLELERVSQKNPFAESRGKLAWPVYGKLETGLGERPGSGVASQGLTLTAAAGSPVRAVHGGQVVFADWLKGFGLLLIIDHGDEYLSIYAHNQSLFRRVGDWVAAAEVIASVGSSGGRSESGLYFEIRHRGTPVDPAPWFAGSPTQAPSRDS